MDDINTHHPICNFGKHRGTLWTRVPVSYLKWILSEGGMSEERKNIARSELKRRGTVTPKIQISGHAIDRVSLHSRKTWHEHRTADEGLHAWLCRIAEEALASGKPDKEGRYHFLDLVFCFEQDGEWPVLKTVLRKKNKQHNGARPSDLKCPECGFLHVNCYCGAETPQSDPVLSGMRADFEVGGGEF